jgi:ribosomal protein S27AE
MATKRWLHMHKISKTGSHNHYCPCCGFLWRHGNKCTQFDANTFEIAHQCPQCGRPLVLTKFPDRLLGGRRPVLRPCVLSKRTIIGGVKDINQTQDILVDAMRNNFKISESRRKGYILLVHALNYIWNLDTRYRVQKGKS